MQGHEYGNGGTILSLVMGVISIANYLICQVQLNIYTWQIPPILLQSIAVLAGIISITSGLIAIRKNTKKQ